MYQMTSEYNGALRTKSIHLKSGVAVITDPPVDNHGKGESFSPTDLVSVALCTCMITIMGIKAEASQIPLEGLKATIEKIMNTEGPRRITGIRIVFEHPNPDVLNDKERDVLKRAAYTCPVALSLHPDIKQEVTFNF